MAVFFTSDTHFGHGNIIKLCGRPFANASEMDELLIARWNETVAPGDTVYHLGDFCYRNEQGADAYLRKLNGEIHLIAGNHDEKTLSLHAHLFASVSLMLEIKPGGQRIVLCHYPMREWNGAWQGFVHFFGHVHVRLEHSPCWHSLDVGLDSHDVRT